MVGKDDPGVDAEGRVAPHPPNSVPQCLNLRHQQARVTVEQVDSDEERSTRNPIAAIVRHAREYAVENGGMRFASPPYACSARGGERSTRSRAARFPSRLRLTPVSASINCVVMRPACPTCAELQST